MSRLINALLDEHYSSTIPTEERLQEEKEKINREAERIKELECQVAKLQEKKAEQKDSQDEEWEKEKEKNRLKHELRIKYSQEIPRDKQTAKGFEEYLKANGLLD
jgi:hypothetical protein